MAELSRVGPPLRLLALLCLLLGAAASLNPIMAQDPPALAAPTSLAASSSAEGVTLTWTAPEGQVDGYEILRRRPQQGETDLSTLVDNTGNDETSYTDASATTPGEHYVYRVKAIRGDERSAQSFYVNVDFVSISCEIMGGDNHDILHCEADAGDLATTSALWTPDFEDQYAQTTETLVVNWVIAPEYCGLSTSVEVAAESGTETLTTAVTTITLDCTPEPMNELAVSCENAIE
ncbi:MAG: fibronectin type III domain-containing protein, partial [Chloroflexota bacterium]|nr:fibronectin type III domain-containing protein [Chloroflexota bacterium]